MKKGFTLIELMVVLAIFTVMTSVVLANYPAFNTRISRDALVQNIALSIREAQVYGTSIRSTNEVTLGGVARSFGMYFGQDQKSYTLFTDRDGNYQFDPATETLNRYTISTGKNKILLTCGGYVYTKNGQTKKREDCEDAAAGKMNISRLNSPRELVVEFNRPNPEAIIIGTLKEGNNIKCGQGDDYGEPLYADNNKICRYSNAAIFIGDGEGTYKKVIIWNTGQIATE